VQQEKRLPFHMVGDFPPPLLIAVNGFDGNSEKLGQLFLGFSQPGSQIFEIFGIHAYP
jgi:hypothetical protein